MSSPRPRVHYPCKYVPVELLAGFGAEMVPVDFEAATFEDADRLAHPNLCGFGKSLLSLALRPEVRCLVLTSCCDVMRRVHDVLAGQQCLDFLWLVDLPHKVGPREVDRLARDLGRLLDAFSAYSGLTFEVGRALGAFAAPRARSDGRVSLVGAHAPRSLLEVAGAAMDLPLENLTCTAERALAAPPPSLGAAEPSGHCAPCADGADPAGPREAFLRWYAQALLTQTPCLRMADVEARRHLIDAPGQHGVIYHTMKFCDYYGFEYTEVKDMATVPVLKVETDGTDQSAGQLRTRLEAFDEAISPKSRQSPRSRRGAPRFVVGVDSGSTSTDACLIDRGGSVVASAIVPTGAKASQSASRALAQVIAEAGLTRTDVGYVVATGYGRDAVAEADSRITEITCHARGAHELMGEAASIIDIGGQDSKVICLGDAGEVANFVMNDKCAAGTGRFLEMMARTMELDLDEFCQEGLKWRHEVQISSMCTVFAESEVVSLVADDTSLPDIIHGLDMAVAKKVAGLATRVRAKGPYLMTGGVARNPGVVAALSTVLGEPVRTSPDSQLCGALGAALLGLESHA